jgi:regulator of protease activity HflC (stomatin/prohibitin superfamily)
MNFVRDAWDVIWEILGWFQVITVLDEWEEGVVLQMGKYRRTVKAGWWLHCPLEIDEFHTMNVRPDAMELDEQTLTTADDYQIVLKVVMMWSVFDIKKAMLDVDNAAETLEQLAVGYVHDLVEVTEWDEIRTKAFRSSLKSHIQKQARKFGITVSQVKLSDCSETKVFRLIN